MENQRVSAGDTRSQSSNKKAKSETSRIDPALESYVNRIVNADCISELQALPDECVDLIVTDPPYVVRYRDRSGRSVLNDDRTEWMLPAFRQAYRVLKDNSFCISFYGTSQAELFLTRWRYLGFRPVGHFVCVKSYASSTGATKRCHECAYLLQKGRPAHPLNPPSDVLPWKYSGNRLHPTQKSVAPIRVLIEAYSKPKDIILDPFAGSGTTGVAARISGRRFILIEKDSDYFAAAKSRLDATAP
jgi:adenine-specific DNA-methyltransferase